MKVYILRETTTLPAPIGTVFEFFGRPENLERITPGWLGFQMLTPLPIAMGRGTLIEYAIHLSGIPLRWTTLITAFDPPYRFVDEQLRGPYSFWHHTHEFRDVGGMTEMIDTVRFAMPFGPLGRLAHGLWVRGQLKRIFAHRRVAIREYFPQPVHVTPDLVKEHR